MITIHETISNVMAVLVIALWLTFSFIVNTISPAPLKLFNLHKLIFRKLTNNRVSKS